jgi:hypothetical protein
MLSNTLNTNEIKNSAGTEIEFSRLGIEGRTTEFAKIGEANALEQRLLISHQESGVGLKRRRRSMIRFNTDVVSDVDTVTPVTDSIYMVKDTPVGALLTNATPLNSIAMMLSFCASLGLSTTILYDGSGNGAQILITGGL